MMMGPMGVLMWVWMVLAAAIALAFLVLLVVLIVHLVREYRTTSGGSQPQTAR
jgi:hypothetical protein